MKILQNNTKHKEFAAIKKERKSTYEKIDNSQTAIRNFISYPDIRPAKYLQVEEWFAEHFPELSFVDVLCFMVVFGLVLLLQDDELVLPMACGDDVPLP